jgi:adhesin/invasin
VTASVGSVSTPASFDLSNSAGSPTKVSVAGGGQSVTVNTAFAKPLKIRFFDQYGNPVPGVPVTFAGPSTGPGVIFSNGNVTITDFTNAKGQVSEAITANTKAGSYSALASVVSFLDFSSFTMFSLTNRPGAPASITATSGGDQSMTVNTAFASPLVATVKDQYGNPVPGASVTFTAPANGASGTFSNLTRKIKGVTDASGQVSEAITANTKAGDYSVTASVGNVSTSASFSLTNQPGPASALAFIQQPTDTSTGQVIAPGVLVAVEDQFGNIVTTDGSKITISIASGAGSFSATSTLTESAVNGIGTFSALMIGQPGDYTLEAADGSLVSATSKRFRITA